VGPDCQLDKKNKKKVRHCLEWDSNQESPDPIKGNGPLCCCRTCDGEADKADLNRSTVPDGEHTWRMEHTRQRLKQKGKRDGFYWPEQELNPRPTDAEEWNTLVGLRCESLSLNNINKSCDHVNEERGALLI
jgi:hypothetical protein